LSCINVITFSSGHVNNEGRLPTAQSAWGPRRTIVEALRCVHYTASLTKASHANLSVFTSALISVSSRHLGGFGFPPQKWNDVTSASTLPVFCSRL